MERKLIRVFFRIPFTLYFIIKYRMENKYFYALARKTFDNKIGLYKYTINSIINNTKKKDLLCSYEEAEKIWNCALEAAQDIPNNNNGQADNEAIIQIQYRVDEILKNRINILK